MLMLMTRMRAYSPPTLLCKALSGCFLSRLLSPKSCNLQVLHALSERNKSSTFGGINNPSFSSMSIFKALKILSDFCDHFDDGVEVKISSLQRNF